MKPEGITGTTPEEIAHIRAMARQAGPVPHRHRPNLIVDVALAAAALIIGTGAAIGLFAVVITMVLIAAVVNCIRAPAFWLGVVVVAVLARLGGLW